MNDTYGYDPENAKIKYHGFAPDSADPGGGGYTPSYTFINPKTGVADPNYRPAPGTVDSLGQSGTPGPQQGHPGGGGGAPTSGLGGSGGTPAATTTTAGTTGTTAATTAAASEATPVAGETVSAANQGVTATPWWQKLLGVAGGGSSAASGSGVLSWLQFAANVYQSQKKGTFVQPPMSPEQRTMFNWAMGQLLSMPSTGGVVNPILQYDIAHPATIDMQAIRDGKVGYTPSGHMPGEDIAALLRAQTSGNGTGTGTATGLGVPPSVPGMNPTDIIGIHPGQP